MKIVDRHTFLRLPSGTLFQKFEPYIFGELCLKKESLLESNDFNYISFTNLKEASITQEYFDILYEMLHDHKSYLIDFDCIARDGFYVKEEYYAIWEKEDILNFISLLQSLV